jgi:hypothetical protein
MRIVVIILLFICPIFTQAQQKKNCYWVENNLQINYRGSIKIFNHDPIDFNASTSDFQLTMQKLDIYLTNSGEMEEYLLTVIRNKGYTTSEKANSSLKDFLTTVYFEVEKEGYWGIFFLLRDGLNGDNFFIGYLTTTSKPKPEEIRMVENFKVVEEGTLNQTINSEEKETPESTNNEIHNQLLSLMQKYSSGIFQFADHYYKLPNERDGEKLFEPYDIADFFTDTIPYCTLYHRSGFIFNLFFNMNSQLSFVAQQESEKTNMKKDIFSILYTPDKRIDIEKYQTPPASIINRNYPQKYKGSNYTDYIFPSSLIRTTQVNGIFGLKSLFISSCYEVKWYNDFLQFYYDNNMANNSFLLEYLYSFPNYAYNALLIKHYIINYLSVLKEEYPDMYLKLKGDEKFQFLIRSYFSMLDQFIRDFNANKTKIRDDIGSQYIPFIEDDTKLVIDQLQYSNNDGLLLFNSLVDYINNEPSYKNILSDFTIEKGEKIILIKE